MTLYFLPTDDVGKGIFSMVHIKSVEEYEDEEYHDYGDDEDDEDTGDGGVFEATTFHPNSVLPADAMDKVRIEPLILLPCFQQNVGSCSFSLIFLRD